MSEWTPSLRYPDPAVRAFDKRFEKYRLPLAGVERLYTGARLGSFVRPMRGSSGSSWRAAE